MARAFFPKLFSNEKEEEAVGVLDGRLPSFLHYRVVYNGPVGIRDFESGHSVRHWFDGLAMLTLFVLDPATNSVSMRKRMLHSEAYKKAKLNDKLIMTEYGTAGNSDPDRNVLSRALATLNPSEMTDNCACSLFSFYDKKSDHTLFLATTETCLLRAIDIDTLETNEERIDLSSLINIMSARPIVDPVSGKMYNLGASFITGPKYHFIEMDGRKEAFEKDDGHGDGGDQGVKEEEGTSRKKKNSLQSSLLSASRIVGSIPSRSLSGFSYYHSMALSSNYLVMVEQPWIVSSVRLASSKIKGVPFKACIDWKPEELNIFHVVEKTGSGKKEKVVFKSRKPFFFLNFVNAYEDEHEQLVVDMVVYDSPDIVEQMYLDKLRKPVFDLTDESQLRRFVLPLKDLEDRPEAVNLIEGHEGARAIKEKNVVWLEPRAIVKETGCEHPSINRKYVGQKYSFCYVIGWLNSVNGGFFGNAVTKVNVESGESVAWQGDNFSHPSEAIFIEDPEGENEDDGVVVVAVSNVRDNEKHFLLVLDARSMTEVARANFEQATIPFSSHAFAHPFNRQ